MAKKIIQKVCGFAVSAAMALSSIAGPVADVWAEESAALAGAGAEEAVQQEEHPVLYQITLPWTEHLVMEPETEHVFIPDPDTRTEEEKKDILLTYEAGEEVEIGIRAEDTWLITKLSFLDEKKEENGYEWKDPMTVHFYMPEKNLTLKAEMTGQVMPEEALQEVPQDAGTGENLSQQAGPEGDPAVQAGAQPEGLPEELQNTTADQAAVPGAGDVASSAQDAGADNSTTQNPENGTGNGQEDGTPADPVPENIQQSTDASVDSGNGTASDVGGGAVTETEPPMTYIPEKDADGLPVQGSIEQTETLEIVKNDAGFDAKIDLRNVPYDPEQYSIEYISDDICLDTIGTYSCIYKVTAPDSGKFFFVLRPVKIVEAQDMAAPLDQNGTETSTEQTAQEKASTEAGSENQTETQTTDTPESSTDAAPETEAAVEASAADETETETEQPSGEYKVTIAEEGDLGVKLDHEDGTYNAGETVTFTTNDSQNLLIAAAALKEECEAVDRENKVHLRGRQKRSTRLAGLRGLQFFRAWGLLTFWG